MSKLLHLFNSLTPGAFCQKCIFFFTFWRFSAWIWAKLAPVYSKRHLQHDSMPFFPLASCFTAFLLRHAQKSKPWDSFGQELKWARSLDFLVSLIFFSPCLFLLFLSFCYSDWPATGLASSSKICEKASSRQSIFTMEKLIVVVGKFAPSFSLKFLSIFVDISGSIEPISLIWVSLERSFPPAELEHRWCQFWWKVMMLEVEQRPTRIMAGYGQHRHQWVNGLDC